MYVSVQASQLPCRTERHMVRSDVASRRSTELGERDIFRTKVSVFSQILNTLSNSLFDGLLYQLVSRLVTEFVPFHVVWSVWRMWSHVGNMCIICGI